MSKTRVNNPLPPVALLIARHSEAKVLCTEPANPGTQMRELNQLDVFNALCRKYAK